MKSKSLFWVIVVILVLLGGYYFSQRGATPGGVVETGPIKVGAIAPLTGDGAVYGELFQNVQSMAVDEINAAGGINGRQIQLVWEDGKCNGTDATTAAQKLLNVDKVRFILGGVCSGETLAAAPLTQGARAILLSAGSSSPDITNAGDLVYRTYPSDALQGKIMATYAFKELKAANVAVISENTDYAQGLRKVFTGTTTFLGGTIVADETYNTSDTDFRTLIAKVKAAKPAFVYVVPQTSASGELVLKQMKEAGLVAKVGVSETMLSYDLIAKSPSLYEGVYGIELALNDTTPKAKTMLAAYKVKYNEDPAFPGYAATAYDAVSLLAEAIKSSGTDAEKVAQYFNTQVKDWPGVIGSFNFDTNGDALLGLNLRKIIGGKVTDIGAYQP